MQNYVHHEGAYQNIRRENAAARQAAEQNDPNGGAGPSGVNIAPGRGGFQPGEANQEMEEEVFHMGDRSRSRNRNGGHHHGGGYGGSRRDGKRRDRR